MIRLARSLRSDDNGAAIIELALVAPVLALMTIGTVDMIPVEIGPRTSSIRA